MTANDKKKITFSMWIGSWNIGSYKKLTKDTLDKWYTEDKEKDIMVFGFQEVDSTDKLKRQIVKLVGDKFKKIIIEDSQNIYEGDTLLLLNSGKDASGKNFDVCTKAVAPGANNFKIGLFIFINQKVLIQLEDKKKYDKDKECFGKKGKDLAKNTSVSVIGHQKETKGFISITLNFIKNKNLSIICCHLPFGETAQYTIDSYRTINGITQNKMNENSIIVFGDLNSRSVIDMDREPENNDFLNGMKKDIDCGDPHEWNNCKGYINCKDGLDEWGDKLSKVNSQNTEPYKDNKSQEIINFLYKRDILKKIIVQKRAFEDFEDLEDPIKFLPTYKRDEKTGEYKFYKSSSKLLKKKVYHGRLPGYPDRIIYKDTKGMLSPVKGTYKANIIKGNDHYPISGELDIKYDVASTEGVSGELDIKYDDVASTEGGGKYRKSLKKKRKSLKKKRKSLRKKKNKSRKR